MYLLYIRVSANIVKVTAAGNANCLQSSQAASGLGTAGRQPAVRDRRPNIDKVPADAPASSTSNSEMSSAIPTPQQRPSKPIVYTEVVPSKMRNKQAPEQPSSSTVDREDSKDSLYTNSHKPSKSTYENVQVQTANVSTDCIQYVFVIDVGSLTYASVQRNVARCIMFASARASRNIVKTIYILCIYLIFSYAQ